MSELKQVKASAGSGKTYQLTRRFLDLLDRADADSPPSPARQGRTKDTPGLKSWP